ncbi:MAG: single-stranded nucleic acid binding domain protein [Actinomycetia bacterium]|nr:single-stranded nucleic acid binding domain protein [Actinomycetes bacterium]
MEWVETTGRTVEEAKDAALDQLGVDEQDAEFEVLEEAKSGLFGRLRQEARVRARVRPTTPRPKVDRRDRKRKPAGDAVPAEDAPVAKAAPRKRAPKKDAPAEPVAAEPVAKAPAKKAAAKKTTKTAPKAPTTTGAAPMEDLDLDAQAANVRSFLEGLVDAFDLQGDVTVETVDEDTLEARVDGDDLGLLIGPKGQTLQAVQELVRAVLQKDGPGGPRLRLDVGGYRERRREALERFTKGIADQVLASGTATSLEPMGAADRKVVHDTVNDIEGIHTISEGEEPRRRVVILLDED